jgi:preprotein translocase subunit SecA
VVDEKHRNITVTDEGWEKVEKLLGIGNVADPKTGRSSITWRPPSRPTRFIRRMSST